jgi:hypothetical protein
MRDGRAIVAVVLSIGISLWLVMVGINIIFQDFPISDQLSTLLSTALGATVGALAVYLGEGRGYEHPEPKPSPEEHPEDEGTT